MMNLSKHLLMKPADEVVPAGGTGYPVVAPPATPAAPESPVVQTPAPTENPEADGKKFDNFGYEITGEEKPKPDEKVVDPALPKPDEKIIDPATGYEENAPKVDEVKPSEPPKEEVKPTDTGLGYELKFEGVPSDEAKSMTDFIKQHKVPKEIAEAYVKQRQAEVVAETKAYEKSLTEQNQKQARELQVTRQKWHKELKDDPTFGGEKFSANIHRSEKVLKEFMPELKSYLTEHTAMLPPHVMKGLARVADVIYKTGNHIQGDPQAAAKNDDSKKASPLDFYNQ